MEYKSTAVAPTAPTKRQREILAHLREREDRGAPPPTLDELCRELGLRSRGSLHKHVRSLIEAGLLEPLDGKQRGVRLSRLADDGHGTLPLLGRIAAGRPIEALSEPEMVAVPAWLRGRGECYLLEVRGDSMIEDGILDRDWVVVERRSHARNGEVVVALIDGAEATLKRIEQTPGRCILHPANADLEPMAFDPARVDIQGVVVAQMRRYG